MRHIVSESVDDNVLHDLCKTMKVSQNRLRDIDDQKETIYEKTYDLLGIWQRKFERNANVGVSKILMLYTTLSIVMIPVN